MKGNRAMKKKITIILALIVGIAFFGCEEDPTGSNGDASQIMFVYAEHDNYYWDEQNDEEVYQENTTGWGVVFGDPLPEFTHLKLGETVFSGDEYSSVYPGYIGIGIGENDEERAMITSNFNPLDVEVKTSLGTVNGTVSLPDTITAVTLSEYDTLQLGESFTVSWTGSNAEVYSVTIEYQWVDENDNWHYEWLDEFVTGNSIAYAGSIFSHNGEIGYIRVQPMNGPLPEEGAIGNMSGDGSGFLYYISDSIYYEGGDIVVGSGMYGGMARTSSSKPNEQVIQERIREKIENKILGNQ